MNEGMNELLSIRSNDIEIDWLSVMQECMNDWFNECYVNGLANECVNEWKNGWINL